MKKVSMMEVSSSNIKKIGYDADRDLLLVEFNNNRIFEYRGVPNDTFLAFLDAKSKGSFLAHHIKPHYKAWRIDDDK